MKKFTLIALLLLTVLFIPGCQEKTASPPNNSNQVKTPLANKTTQNAAVKPVQPQVQPQVKPTNSTPSQSASYSWYLIPNSQHTAPGINNNAAALLAENQAIYMLPNESKRIYLSFDCGYELGYTPTILDILQRKQIKAAFFITGQYINTKPDLVKRMHAEGHLVCNHTLNHPDLAKVDQDKLQQEINSLEQKYQDLTGVPLDKYIRPPMGSYSADSLKWTKEMGYTTVFWSMAWKDWDPKQQPGADFVYKHVMNNIHPGAIILMHAVSASDTEALEKIITDLQAQGYVFSTFNN